MKISAKELELIASTPEEECAICNDIIEKMGIDHRGNRHISTKWLQKNPDIKEHLRQIIGR